MDKLSLTSHLWGDWGWRLASSEMACMGLHVRRGGFNLPDSLIPYIGAAIKSPWDCYHNVLAGGRKAALNSRLLRSGVESSIVRMNRSSSCPEPRSTVSRSLRAGHMAKRFFFSFSRPPLLIYFTDTLIAGLWRCENGREFDGTDSTLIGIDLCNYLGLHLRLFEFFFLINSNLTIRLDTIDCMSFVLLGFFVLFCSAQQAMFPRESHIHIHAMIAGSVPAKRGASLIHSRLRLWLSGTCLT